MAGTFKATAMRDELASELAIRLPTKVQLKAFGAAGEADLTIGDTSAFAAGEDAVFIRFTGVTSLQKDVLGLAQNVFTPHIAQVVVEGNPVGGAGADVGTWATRLTVLGCLVAKGIKVELYVRANTNAVGSAGITGTPASFEIHPQYPMMASI